MNKNLKRKLIFSLGSKLGWLVILMLGRTSRITFVNRQVIRRLQADHAKIIFALWHGRIMLPIYVHRGEGIAAMVSLHRDGEMIAQNVHRLGYKTVRGSSTRGGKQALHDMVDLLNQGVPCTIMPDGPRGPRHKLKAGVIYMAQQTGAYLVPLTFACKRKIQFHSWDRFNFITPFSKAVVIYGDPIRIPSELSSGQFEEMRKMVEMKMIENETMADDYFKK
ncbi:lysophospholipid acyltransferase family protein [candidate division KSB1 bacterium]|nr:lysophospholipid acyltransferase family protein [candidate division KSB1 bacterium]